MAGEEWARRILEKKLKRDVVINDDGSKDGMYDLRVGPADAPEMAVECVAAVDPIFTETWNLGPAKGPLELTLEGDWSITLTPSARVNVIKQRVEPLLRELEDQGLHNVSVNHALKQNDSALFEELSSLEVTRADCFRLPGTGKVHLLMSGIGGAVDSQGAAVPRWVGEFLRDSDRQDVLRKLQRSGATDRQAFVFVTFGGSPWPVQYYLMTELDQIPAEAPDLPPPVTGVWVVSQFGQRGLRWDGGAWRLFEAQGEGIDD
jgi:hypothetical protein